MGVGVRPSYLGGQKLPDILDRFVGEHPIAAKKLRCGEVLAVMRGLVPAGGSPEMIQKDNMLLAGDAAGHVMATSGGGIPLAMVAGRIAGEVANGHLKGRDASARVSVAHTRRVWNRAEAVGADKKNGGHGHEERSSHECPFGFPEPRDNEIHNARTDACCLFLGLATME